MTEVKEEIKQGDKEDKAYVDAKEGKYLTFGLGGEEYGLEILKVKEIIGIMDITMVPQTPEFVKGVINLRGKVIPVVDLRLKFTMPTSEYTRETCIIVVDVENILMGIIVDTVSEVMNIQSKDIEPAPSFGSNINTDFITGIGKLKEKVVILLDIEGVLSNGEMNMVSEIVANA